MKTRNSVVIYSFIFIVGLIMLANSCKKNPENENPVNKSEVTDIDGNVYKTITIGTQVWMAENLKVTHFRNGDAIATTKPEVNVSGQVLPYQWGYINYDVIYFLTTDTIYGRLYNWYSVTDPRNICPIGWHVPSAAEWATLTNFLGGEDIAGGKLKATDTTYWKSPNSGATNESGFLALPGGIRFVDGEFGLIGQECNFWTSTVDPNYSGAALRYNLDYNRTWALELGLYKEHAASVRCIKDP